jgi:hypothetical protein
MGNVRLLDFCSSARLALFLGSFNVILSNSYLQLYLLKDCHSGYNLGSGENIVGGRGGFSFLILEIRRVTKKS